jgi:hypothetical protein
MQEFSTIRSAKPSGLLAETHPRPRNSTNSSTVVNAERDERILVCISPVSKPRIPLRKWLNLSLMINPRDAGGIKLSRRGVGNTARHGYQCRRANIDDE